MIGCFNRNGHLHHKTYALQQHLLQTLFILFWRKLPRASHCKAHFLKRTFSVAFTIKSNDGQKSASPVCTMHKIKATQRRTQKSIFNIERPVFRHLFQIYNPTNIVAQKWQGVTSIISSFSEPNAHHAVCYFK